MSGNLKILNSGFLASIQDKGRLGMGRFGVPRSGAIDPVTLRLGNALVENDDYEAAIEFRFLGPKICAVNGSVRIGLAAHTQATLTHAATQENSMIKPWQSVTLNEGDILSVAPLKDNATGYLTIEGGIDLHPTLGSLSTYSRAKLGGINGDILQSGDLIPLRKNKPKIRNEKIITKPVKIPHTHPFKVIAGPQDDYFSSDEMIKFCQNRFNVSHDVDRMGIRLDGSYVQSLPDKGNDLISDGLIPGVIQIPGNGNPIILCVDCQSVGGYPKIAKITNADWHILGKLIPNQKITFQLVDLPKAKVALLALEKNIKISISSIKDLLEEGAINLDALYQSNLIDGMVDATFDTANKEKPKDIS